MPNNILTALNGNYFIPHPSITLEVMEKVVEKRVNSLQRRKLRQLAKDASFRGKTFILTASAIYIN